ncbi:unnamed protein product [Brassica oleracea]
MNLSLASSCNISRRGVHFCCNISIIYTPIRSYPEEGQLFHHASHPSLHTQFAKAHHQDDSVR